MESEELKRSVGETFEKGVSDLLKKKNRDFLSLTEVKMGLSSDILKALDLKRSSLNSDFVKKVKPHLSGKLKLYENISSYIGYSKSDEELILDLVRKNEISVKKAFKVLPIAEESFRETLDRLVGKKKISVFLDEKFISSLKIYSSDLNADKKLFETRSREMFGDTFIRIHRIREELNWEKERFDKVLESLAVENRIELLGGDPSEMEDDEIDNSYMDNKGRLRIMLTWR